MSALDWCASYDDYRRLAKRRIPRTLFDYLDGGSLGEITLRRNVCDLAAIEIEQRVARDMSKVDVATNLFGRRLAMPAVLAPVGFAGMYARRGEVQAARAAAATGIPFCLSTVGICSADELATANLPFWYQLYILRDRGVVAALLDRVRALGCETLVVTVDLPTPAIRYRDIRSGMSGKLDWLGQAYRLFDGATHPEWVWDVYVRGRPHTFGNLQGIAPIASNFVGAWNWIGANFDPSVTWNDLAKLRARWPGKMVVKGILHEEDAREAVQIGCDGIVVSNHGGRQLDGAASTISVLPRIADAVKGEVTLLADGGIRAGLDMLKMLRAGADACLVGRLWATTLAAGGEAGVTRMLTQLEFELKAGIVLSGDES